MKMDYRRDLQHNYLVVETGEKTENYITRMMTENQVQGLLGCECRRMDQKKLYYYDITSKISLAEKSRLKKVKGSEVLLIIQGLLQVLVQLEEYLIPADQICLDWNYIYLDPYKSALVASDGRTLKEYPVIIETSGLLPDGLKLFINPKHLKEMVLSLIHISEPTRP